MLYITRVELLQVNLLCLFPQVNPLGHLIAIVIIQRVIGLGTGRQIHNRSASIGLLLLLLALLDECDFADLVPHILQALLLQLPHEALHRLHLGEEKVLLDPVQLAAHTKANKRGHMGL